MIRNYCAVTLRHLNKNRLFSVINITGLALGLTACILIGTYIQNELSYDRHWENAERIYRLNTTIDRIGGNPVRHGINPFAAVPALKNYFGEDIQFGSRVIAFDIEVLAGTSRFESAIPEVDPEILDIFDFEVVYGNLPATFKSPGRIALSESLAMQYFGTLDVTGRTLTLISSSGGIERRRDVQVSAVYRVPDYNTLLDLPAMTLLDESRYPYLFNWMILSTAAYLMVAPDADVTRLNTLMENFANQHVDISAMQAGPDVKPGDRVQFDLQSVRDVYLNAPANVAGGNASAVLAFSLIALLVLLIGCINFAILNTATVAQRSREVAIRKIVGARRAELMLQFLGESLLVVLLAMTLSLVMVELLLPFFGGFVGKELDLRYSTEMVWLMIGTLLVVVIIAGGLYPAFVLARLKTTRALLSDPFRKSRAAISFRSVLVFLQFSITIALMIATTVVYVQLAYTTDRDPGFNKENLLVIEDLMSRAAIDDQKDVLKGQLEALPGITAASLSGHRPMQRTDLSTVVAPYSMPGTSTNYLQLATLSVDSDFVETYQIPIVAGRDFAEDRDQESLFFRFVLDRSVQYRTSAVVNESAARALGFARPGNAVGQQIETTSPYNGSEQVLTIIGVVADTQFYTLRSEPRPEVYLHTPAFTDVLTLRYSGDTQAMLAQLDKLWSEVTAGAALSVDSVEQIMSQELARERTEARLLISFSMLAIVVACMGLFGSAAFNVERRTKEIGIRKVVGAEVKELVALLVWQFSKPVLLANLLAWPVAVWAMLAWLQRFPYQIDGLFLLPLCLVAGAAALLVAWLTVAGNTIRVASMNPIGALRYE